MGAPTFSLSKSGIPSADLMSKIKNFCPGVDNARSGRVTVVQCKIVPFPCQIDLSHAGWQTINSILKGVSFFVWCFAYC